MIKAQYPLNKANRLASKAHRLASKAHRSTPLINLNVQPSPLLHEALFR